MNIWVVNPVYLRMTEHCPYQVWLMCHMSLSFIFIQIPVGAILILSTGAILILSTSNGWWKNVFVLFVVFNLAKLGRCPKLSPTVMVGEATNSFWPIMLPGMWPWHVAKHSDHILSTCELWLPTPHYSRQARETLFSVDFNPSLFFPETDSLNIHCITL